jgi:hypothetical protein
VRQCLFYYKSRFSFSLCVCWVELFLNKLNKIEIFFSSRKYFSHLPPPPSPASTWCNRILMS